MKLQFNISVYRHGMSASLRGPAEPSRPRPGRHHHHHDHRQRQSTVSADDFRLPETVRRYMIRRPHSGDDGSFRRRASNAAVAANSPRSDSSDHYYQENIYSAIIEDVENAIDDFLSRSSNSKTNENVVNSDNDDDDANIYLTPTNSRAGINDESIVISAGGIYSQYRPVFNDLALMPPYCAYPVVSNGAAPVADAGRDEVTEIDRRRSSVDMQQKSSYCDSESQQSRNSRNYYPQPPRLSSNITYC